MNKKSGLCLSLILCGAAVLRLWNLGIGDLATDEAKTALGIAYPHSFVLPNLSALSQSVFGPSEWAVRLPFALFGVLTVWLWYVVGAKLKNKNFGLVLAGLAAVIPTNVIFSRTAYLDAPVIVVWLAALFFWLTTEQESEKRWAHFGLWFFLMLAPFFKLQAIYLHITFGLIILGQTKGKFWQDARTWLIAISILPIALYVLGQPQQMYDIYSYVFQQSSGVNAGGGLGLFIKTIVFWLWPFLFFLMAGLWVERKNIFNIKNNYLPLFGVGLIALVFSILGTRQLYYLAMTDTLFVLGAGLGIWYVIEQNKIVAQALVLLVVLWSGWVIGNTTSVSQNYCVTHENSCYWQSAKTARWIEKIQTEKNSTYYLDENLGYLPKWRLPFETKKIDSLMQWFEKINQNVVLIVGQGSGVAKLTEDPGEVSDAVVKVLVIKAADNNPKSK